MDSKAKVAGPLAAAGAVSLGLVFIGACGVGQEDTRVPPPPIRSGSQAVEQAHYEDEAPSSTIAPVVIPPSPSWRMAPSPAPQRTLPPEYQISATTDAPEDSDENSEGPDETPDRSDTTRRATSSAGNGPTPLPESESAEVEETTTVESPEVEPAHSRSSVPTAPPGTDTGLPGEQISPSDDSSTGAAPEYSAEEEPSVPTEPAETTLLPSAPVTGQPTSEPAPTPDYGTTAPETGTPDTTVPTITIDPGNW